MRHLNKGRKLGRTAEHRKATLRALSIALIKNHRIVTTLPKAKELRTVIEPIITRAKEDNLHNRQQVFSFLNDKESIIELFSEIGPLVKERQGGYTRVIKIGTRQGDGAEMAMIELVDFNDVKPEGKAKKKKTRRAGSAKKATPATESTDAAEASAE